DLALANFDAQALETSIGFSTSQAAFAGSVTLNFEDTIFDGPLRTSGHSGSVLYGFYQAFEGAGFEGRLADTNLPVYTIGTYTISVVPEPSTYAAIAGGLGLAAAVIHRRRQRVKAAQA
ncbi:MAG: PEP-CTERM sorting domain-containing protein, partial [Opitutaceae bacterium]